MGGKLPFPQTPSQFPSWSPLHLPSDPSQAVGSSSKWVTHCAFSPLRVKRGTQHPAGPLCSLSCAVLVLSRLLAPLNLSEPLRYFISGF